MSNNITRCSDIERNGNRDAAEFSSMQDKTSVFRVLFSQRTIFFLYHDSSEGIITVLIWKLSKETKGN